MSGRIMRADEHEELQAKYDNAMAELAILRKRVQALTKTPIELEDAFDIWYEQQTVTPHAWDAWKACCIYLGAWT